MAHGMAIVGYGGMGAWHAFNQKGREEFTVTGAYDIRPERNKAAGEDGYKAYESFEHVLQDPSVELVLIATPNNFHKPLGIRALRAGKAVMVEKPAVLNAAEWEELMAVSLETGKLLTVHQNRRWDTDYRIIRSIVEQKPLGEAYMLESRVQGSRQVLTGWRGYVQNGGGMLYDWGIHLLDQYLDMFKTPVTEVYCQLFNIFATEADDNFKALLRFENKMSVLLEVSMNCFIKHPRWHISCQNGSAIVEDWDCAGKMVRLAVPGELEWEESIVYTAAGPTRSMAPRPPETVEELPLPQVEVDRYELFRNVAAALEGKEQLLVRPEQTLRVLRVMDAMFASNKSGQSIKCHL